MFELKTSPGAIIGTFPVDERYTFIGSSVEYLSDRVWIRGEYFYQVAENDVDLNTRYIEVAYKVTEHWQIAARYEIDAFEIRSFQTFDLKLEHRDLAIGLNYWFNPNFVVRLSTHHIDGNHFAYPADLQEYLQGDFEDTTNLIVFGAQFSF